MAAEELKAVRKRYIITIIVYCLPCIKLAPDAYIEPTIRIAAAQRPLSIIIVGRRPLWTNLQLGLVTGGSYHLSV